MIRLRDRALFFYIVGSAWPLTMNIVGKAWARLNARAGVPRVRFHDLGAQPATLMLARRPPQDRERDAGPRHHRHHAGHLFARHPDHAAGGCAGHGRVARGPAQRLIELQHPKRSAAKIDAVYGQSHLVTRDSG